MGITIRNAYPEDVDWLLPQLRAFSKMCGLERPIVGSDEQSRKILTEMISEGPFFVAEREAVRLGFIAGTLHAHRFNPELRVLSEMFFWVDPRFRYSRAALLLLEEFKRYGEAAADMISFSLLSNSPVKSASLIRRGFKPIENSFMMEVA